MKLKIKKIKPEFRDDRGYISRIVEGGKYKIHSILYIERKKGSIGANHYHKKDAHYVYVLSGKVKRYEKDMTKKNPKVYTAVLVPGDLILTEPMIAHKDEFLEDTVILAFTTEDRNQKSYEKDTVREDFFEKDSS